MNINHPLTISLAVTLLLFSQQARSVEVMSTEELAVHCAELDRDPKSEDAIFCVRYIQGFIDGAIATDGRVTQNVVDEYERDESFTDRAIRTRGIHDYVRERMGRYGPSVFAEFCLGDPVPLREVVDAVVARLADEKSVEDFPDARDLVYATLRASYPCQIDE